MNKANLNFSGGMNTKVAPLILQDTECELIVNYNLDTIGALTKRNGYDVFASQPVAAKTILGMFMFNDTSGSETNALMVANNSGDTQSVIYENASGTWTSRDTTSTASAKTRFATFIDYVFRVNGSNTVLTSADLSTWAAVNAPATITPKYINVYEDRVYVANGGSSTGSRVYFSSLPSGSPLAITWTTATDYFDVNPDDGDNITGLENNGNRLLIFKNRALYRWQFGQVEPDRLIGVGTSSQECVKTNLDAGITFFANQHGVYSYTGGRPKLISRKIQKFFDACSSTDVGRFVAEVDADHYYVYLSDSVVVDGRTYTNLMAVYTISLDAWVLYSLHTPIRSMARFIASGIESIYFGSTNGRTYKFNSGTADDSGGANSDTATPIAGEIVFKEMLLGFPYGAHVDYIDIISAQRTAAQIFYRGDRKDIFNPLGDLTARVSNFKLNDDIGSIQLKIVDNSTSTSVIDGYNIEFTPFNERRRINR